VIPSIARIERGAYRTWSPDDTVDIGGWTVGSNGGFTRRANSATTRGPADTSPETGRRIRAWLEARASRMAVRITPLVPPGVAAEASATWRLIDADPTPVLVRPLVPVAAPQEVLFVDAADPDFAEALHTLNRRPSSSVSVWGRLVDRLDGPHTGLRIGDVAVGFVAVTDGIAFVYSVAVDVGHRRRGLGTAIMEAAHAYGRGNGAEVAVLQVLGTNQAAQALYRNLGYRERYRYHYLQDAASASA
jgi:ribosomal protein S18 acetylase RimI-like enzyme